MIFFHTLNYVLLEKCLYCQTKIADKEFVWKISFNNIKQCIIQVDIFIGVENIFFLNLLPSKGQN